MIAQIIQCISFCLIVDIKIEACCDFEELLLLVAGTTVDGVASAALTDSMSVKLTSFAAFNFTF